jgi:hypothetical protein
MTEIHTMNTSTTSMPNMISILHELSMSPTVVLPDFRQFHDVGLPLASLYSLGYIDILNEKAQDSIQYTFDMLLHDGNLEDVGYTSLNEILAVYSPDDETETYEED